MSIREQPSVFGTVRSLSLLTTGGASPVFLAAFDRRMGSVPPHLHAGTLSRTAAELSVSLQLSTAGDQTYPFTQSISSLLVVPTAWKWLWTHHGSQSWTQTAAILDMSLATGLALALLLFLVMQAGMVLHNFTSIEAGYYEVGLELALDALPTPHQYMVADSIMTAARDPARTRRDDACLVVGEVKHLGRLAQR